MRGGGGAAGEAGRIAGASVGAPTMLLRSTSLPSCRVPSSLRLCAYKALQVVVVVRWLLLSACDSWRRPFPD